MHAMSASHSRAADSTSESSTACRSKVDRLITLSTSDVAVCCSRALASSRVRALTCSCRSARVELAGRAAVGALLRLGFLGLACCVFAGLRLMARRRLIEPSHGPTTIRYHIKGSVVQHSKMPPLMSVEGQTRSIGDVGLECAPGAGQVEINDLTG